MIRCRALLIALCVVSLSVAAPRAVAAPREAAGRELLQRHADAIVSVELVVTLKVKVGDREAPPHEQRVDVNGTVISPEGLTVASLAEVDPQIAFEAMRAGQGSGSRFELLGADFNEVKLRLADGTEVPARFALKDADLDLAFMIPDEESSPPRKFAYIDLAKATTGRILDSYFSLSRAPKSLQRVPLIRTSSIAGIVERPRRFYLMTEPLLGSPMLAADGRVLGLSLQHFANGRRMGVVVLPAPDIAEIARQVRVKPAASSAPAKPAAGGR